jgi:hypothetical protein
MLTRGSTAPRIAPLSLNRAAQVRPWRPLLLTPAPPAASRGLVLASRHRVVGPGLGFVRFLRRLTVARAAHMVALMLRLIFTLAWFMAVISTLALTMIVSHLVTPL